MSSMWGNHFKISLFGESHGQAIGITIDGLEPGFPVDFDAVAAEMARRSPGKNPLATSRKEADAPKILSGILDGKTTGAPLCAVIENTNTRSGDYARLDQCPRPGHADYPAAVRFGGHADWRGGGHFSGRLTAPVVFCGALVKQILAQKGVFIGSHIKSLGPVEDTSFSEIPLGKELFDALASYELPLVDQNHAPAVTDHILAAKMDLDSVGGVVECAAIGLPAGLGNPFFGSVESVLSSLIFSIPGVKGVEFGDGFAISQMRGSQANDAYYYDGGKVKTRTNHNGGVLGGITNGMPVLFRAAFKPTPSIAKEQQTVNLAEQTNTTLQIKGRHDPCIVVRAVPVVEAMAAIGLYDLLKGSSLW